MSGRPLLPRLVYYFKTGYIQYISYPIGFVSFSSTVYYLAINNIPALKSVFPNFYLFLAFAVLSIPSVSIGFGYWHFKRSSFFQSEQDIAVESSRYNRDILLPVGLLGAKALCELARLHGLDVSGYEQQIRVSEEAAKS